MFSGPLQKDLFIMKVKFGEKLFQTKFNVMPVKQGLPSSFLSRPVA